jgi:hypothetical protein
MFNFVCSGSTAATGIRGDDILTAILTVTLKGVNAKFNAYLINCFRAIFAWFIETT